MKKKLALLLVGGGMLAALGGAGTASADTVGACNAQSSLDGPGQALVVPVPDPRGGNIDVYGNLDQGSQSGDIGVAGADGFIQAFVLGGDPTGSGVSGSLADSSTVSGEATPASGVCLVTPVQQVVVPPVA